MRCMSSERVIVGVGGCVGVWMWVCLWVSLSVCVYVGVYVGLCLCVYVCVCVCICVCVCVFVCVIKDSKTGEADITKGTEVHNLPDLKIFCSSHTPPCDLDIETCRERKKILTTFCLAMNQ